MGHLCSSTSFVGKGIIGYGRLMKQADNYSLLVKHPEIKRKLEILSFFNEFGLKPTMRAFKIKRSTIYLWKKKLRDADGKLYSLANRSKKPHTTRRMYVDEKVYQFIKGLRRQYPRLGKDKISFLLADFCSENNLEPIKPSTIGKLIKRNNWFFYLGERRKHKRVRPDKKRLFGYPVSNPGDLFQVDTIVKFELGIKRYIVTAIDVTSKFAFAYTYNNHSSRSVAHFMETLVKVTPYPIRAIQTDNGSEFLSESDEAMDQHGIVHFFTYPNSPKQNAVVERFNRTIQEEYIANHEDNLPDTKLFNNQLIDYLLFYNTKRPHQALGYEVPMKHATNYLEKSNMYATNALDCTSVY